MSIPTSSFGFVVTDTGLRITVNGEPISITLLGTEIEHEIQAMKADLDELCRRMKAADREWSAKAWKGDGNA